MNYILGVITLFILWFWLQMAVVSGNPCSQFSDKPYFCTSDKMGNL